MTASRAALCASPSPRPAIAPKERTRARESCMPPGGRQGAAHRAGLRPMGPAAVRAERSYHGSAHFKGIPVWEPQYTVIEIETGVHHGTYDSMTDVALCLAFAKLDRDRVEIVTDAPITASCTA